MAKVSTTKRPPVWMMVKQAVESMNGEATYKDIKDYIRQNYKDINERTVNCQIVICSVNQKSRVYYPANHKPRECQGRYDFLYTLGNGRVTMYDPKKHGRWGIVEEGSKVTVARLDDIQEVVSVSDQVELERPNTSVEPSSPTDREFILSNFSLLGSDLHLFIDSSGRQGLDYAIEPGVIDVLAVNKQKQMVVIQYAESVTPDSLAQMLSFTGWVRHNLSQGKQVKGILLAGQVDEKMLLVVSELPNVEIYQVKVTVEFTKATV
ncbi:MAG: hypothetical protein ACM3QW_04720 [Ignavibacteriales bacterium]